MNRQQGMEQTRQASIQAWAQAQRQALHEATKNTPVNPAQAAGASSTGGGVTTGLYGVAYNGLIYSIDTLVNWDFGDQFPDQTVCCDKGDGTFYASFFWQGNGIFWFGTINGTTGEIIPYDHNIDEVAQTGTPCSLHLEPDGSVIMLDNKYKKGVRGLIRIEIDGTTADATYLTEVSDVNGLLMCTFSKGDEAWGIKGSTETRHWSIGQISVNTGEFLPGWHEIILKKNGLTLNYGDNIDNLLALSATYVASRNKTYISTIYPDDPDTGEFEVGIFEVDTETGVANWLEFAYATEGGSVIYNLFSKS